MCVAPWPHTHINGINYCTVYHLSAIHFSNSEYAIMLRASRAFFLRAAVALHSLGLTDAAECRERAPHEHACEKKRVLLLTYKKL